MNLNYILLNSTITKTYLTFNVMDYTVFTILLVGYLYDI